ncbi:hypothetical protein PUATCC27989T_00471 [Phytobacter ursingii]|nr:hypothetical protein PUATCC27989T_00471 [Phytobacter ursingii]
MGTLLNHSGEKLKILEEENYQLRRERTLLRQQISSLSHRLDMAQKELSLRNYDISSIPPIPITKQVAEWINEYGVPWEALYCPHCRSWFSELDSSFPYHIDSCVCKCEEKEKDNG